MGQITLLNEAGELIEDKFESVNYVNKVNKLPYVEVVLKDESEEFDADKMFTLAFSDSHTFTGVVSEKIKQISEHNFSYKVKLIHPAIQLTKVRKTKIFSAQTESAILESIVTSYADVGDGLAYEYVTPDNDAVVDQLIQHDCTDWDFLLARAEANGCLVTIDGNTISLVNKANLKTTKSDVKIESSQIKLVCLKSYHQQAIDETRLDIHNYQDKDLPLTDTAKKSALPASLSVELTPAATESKAYNFKGVFGDVLEAKAWANGKQMRNILARIQGEIVIKGFPNAALLDPISLAGQEDMKGDTFLTGIEMNFQHDKVETTVTIGLAETEFMNLHQVHSPPAGNLLPGIQGLQIGYVGDVEPQDATPEDRIKIILPSLNIGAEKTTIPIWARLAFVSAGNKRGVFFAPEVGDEVLVGFLNNDPRHPLVLGSLYTHKVTDEKPYTINTEANEKSGIVTKSGLVLEFDDNADTGGVTLYSPGADAEDPTTDNFSFSIKRAENGSVEISNGANNFISLTKTSVVIADKKDAGNKIELNDDGIKLSSNETSILIASDKIEFISGNSTMTLDGEIELKTGDSKIKLDGKVEVKSGSSTIKLDSKIELKSGSTMKLNSSGLGVS